MHSEYAHGFQILALSESLSGCAFHPSFGATELELDHVLVAEEEEVVGLLVLHVPVARSDGLASPDSHLLQYWASS